MVGRIGRRTIIKKKEHSLIASLSKMYFFLFSSPQFSNVWAQKNSSSKLTLILSSASIGSAPTYFIISNKFS